MRWLNRHSPAIQATGSILAVIIASAATIIAAKTLSDQTELNQLAVDRFERRHASRVAWWYDRDYQWMDLKDKEHRARLERASANSVVDYETITLQNRSPVSMSQVVFAVGKVNLPATGWLLIPDLRPCESMRVRLRAERDKAVQFVDDGTALRSDLYFLDPALVYWQNGFSGLVKDDSDLRVRDSGEGLLLETKVVSRAPAADCGESA
jgi:hypothetical protein